jgi:hypothetical protein
MVTSIATWVMLAIIIGAVIAIGYVILRQMGIAVPPWAVTVFWIFVAAIVGILAIKLLLQMVAV